MQKAREKGAARYLKRSSGRFAQTHRARVATQDMDLLHIIVFLLLTKFQVPSYTFLLSCVVFRVGMHGELRAHLAL